MWVSIRATFRVTVSVAIGVTIAVTLRVTMRLQNGWPESLLVDVRFPHILDSSVALGSPLGSLRKVLMKSTASQLAVGLYPAALFGPTRHNVAHDPTWDAPLRSTCRPLCLPFSGVLLGPQDLRWFLARPDVLISMCVCAWHSGMGRGGERFRV